MRTLFGVVVVGLVALAGCSSEEKKINEQDLYFHQQEDQQGYPVLIASPMILDYGLPFCEKAYCLEVELFGFKSKDEWFNAFVEQQVAELIRKQLSLSQKQSVQSAVDEFIKKSDAWLEEDQKNIQPWSMYIYPSVIWQNNEITILKIDSQYTLGDQDIPNKQFYSVVDRKNKKTIKLYDLISDHSRLEFGAYVQQKYQEWLEKEQQVSEFPDKVFWANQDWYLDDEDFVIYYRATDFKKDAKQSDLLIYLSKDQASKWMNEAYLHQLYLN